MTNNLALIRLEQERKSWRKDHPFGFYAKPRKKADGTLDLQTWDCGVPGKENTVWAGGLYKISMKFSDNYPADPPKITFSPLIFHPNVYPSGALCLSITNAHEEWKPSITVKQILLGIQTLLDEPNCNSPANQEASKMYRNERDEYNAKAKETAKRFAADLG